MLHALSSFDQDVLDDAAVLIVQGLAQCVTGAAPLGREITNSPDFWSILQRLHQHAEGAYLVFELLQTIVDSSPPTISADNYEAAVNLANDFASAARVGAAEEQRRDIARRGKQTKQSKSQYVYPSLSFA